MGRNQWHKDGKKPKKPKEPKKPNNPAAQVAPAAEPSKEKEVWTDWERKLDEVSRRDVGDLARAWAGFVPDIPVPGAAPQVLPFEIADVIANSAGLGRQGSVKVDGTGLRSAVLHEGMFLLQKAVHVEIDVAESIAKGRHTWGAVNAYQGALFALAGLLAILGISTAKDDVRGGVVLIDVWPEKEKRGKRIVTEVFEEAYVLVRFRELDHYQKWGLLKKVLNVTSFSRQYPSSITEALDNIEDRKHARDRNKVNYKSSAWLGGDLLIDVPDGIVAPAASFQDIFDGIYNLTHGAAVYTLVSLVEIACEVLSSIPGDSAVVRELELLSRRRSAVSAICHFDWSALD